MRTRKPKDAHVAFEAHEYFNGYDCSLVLVKGGKLAYLNAHRRDPGVSSVTLSFSGAKSLRKLAYAILDEVGND